MTDGCGAILPGVEIEGNPARCNSHDHFGHKIKVPRESWVRFVIPQTKSQGGDL